MKRITMAALALAMFIGGSGYALAGSGAPCTTVEQAIGITLQAHPKATSHRLSADQLAILGQYLKIPAVLDDGAWFEHQDFPTVYVIATMKGCVRFAREIRREQFNEMLLGKHRP